MDVSYEYHYHSVCLFVYFKLPLSGSWTMVTDSAKYLSSLSNISVIGFHGERGKDWMEEHGES